MPEIIEAALTEDLVALWRIRPPGPPNLLTSPEFTHLLDTCIGLYPDKARSRNGLSFALANALQALGLPSKLVPGRRMDAISGEERIIARRLARKVVQQLAKASLTMPNAQSRYDYLTDLLSRGAGLGRRFALHVSRVVPSRTP
jgi:hypothetical protein